MTTRLCAALLVLAGCGERKEPPRQGRGATGRGGLAQVAPVITGELLPRPGTPFRFSAAGDLGATAATDAVLALIPASGDFFLALGDLSYGHLEPETAWCDYVEQQVGAGYPFAVVAGNHDEDGIDAFIAADCLPNRLPGVVGDYGKEYWFDYPPQAPLARLIMISPDIDFPEGEPDFSAGSAHYQWTADAIDGAREAGLAWVVVAMHVNCITIGVKDCETGADLLNLLVDRRVDLILQGHDHNYQRSLQLALSERCQAMVPGFYDQRCVADRAERSYRRGAGSVIVINGTGGMDLYPVAPADAEESYFVGYDATTHGLTQVDVGRTRLTVRFLPAIGGSYVDWFTIE
jgi:hypothetical protein